MASQTTSVGTLLPDPADLADVVRDEHYYPTGDSIFRVEHTLFKIHKFLLIHNSPVFASMFSLPSGMNKADGSSDELPIVLEGETVGDFRAVLKYLYAPPIEVQINNTGMVSLPEIISLANLSHKYEMDHWKKWALAILDHLLLDLDSVPVEHFLALYSLYHRLSEVPMRSRVMKSWCKVVERDDLPINYLLNAADAREDKDAIADIYCILIRRWEKRARILDPESFTEDGVTAIHIQRINSGYMSLSLSWSRFSGSDAPYPFEDTGCHGFPPHHEIDCIPYYRRLWTQAISAAEARYPHITQMADRLCYVGQSLQENNSGCSLEEEECLEHFIRRFNNYLQDEFKVHCLADHFFVRNKSASPK